MKCLTSKYYLLTIKNIVRYFASLQVAFHELVGLWGFFTFIVIASQLVSGICLALSYEPESMMVPLVRDEEDVEDLYTDDFFWLHERGVDMLFLMVFGHMGRKLYLVSAHTDYESELAWKTGAFTYLILQFVVFTGLTLCDTHLSDITLTIATNAINTFCAYVGKPGWVLFTDGTLNADTNLRLAYMHYISAFWLAILGAAHGVEMHYDWKPENFFDGLTAEPIWMDETLSGEVSKSLDVFFLIYLGSSCIYTEPEALSYELFMWGDVGLTPDIRFLSVAPHWYFRPFMAWLIVCPHAVVGLFGLVFFFLSLYFQPNLVRLSANRSYSLDTVYSFSISVAYFFDTFQEYLGVSNHHSVSGFLETGGEHAPLSFAGSRYHVADFDFWYDFLFCVFLGSILYTSTFLPYGRFYGEVGGNFGMLLAYFFVFVYLAFPIFRDFSFFKNYSVAKFKLFRISLFR